MIIEFDTSIYSKESLYIAKDAWLDYFDSLTFREHHSVFEVSLTLKDKNDLLVKEFINYIIDLNASLEIT